MPLWKDGRFVDDDWRILADDEPLPDEAPAIVSLKRWREQRGELQGRNAALGLLIAPGGNWSDIVGDLPRFPVIVVTIPNMPTAALPRSLACCASATAIAAKSAPSAISSSTRCR